MTDACPILCTVSLGNLRPANDAAVGVVQALGNGARVAIEVKQATPNQKRLAFYWLMLKVAADNLAEQVDDLTAEDLHEIVKQKLGLGKWIELPSGDRVFRAKSIAFSKMREPERAEFINRVDVLLSRWLGCAPGSVIDAARTREAA